MKIKYDNFVLGMSLPYSIPLVTNGHDVIVDGLETYFDTMILPELNKWNFTKEQIELGRETFLKNNRILFTDLFCQPNL